MQISRLFRRMALLLPSPNLGRNTLVPFTAAVLLSCGASIGHAQASSGLTGTITDNSGAIIPGASVSIVNVATQQTVTVVTSSAGQYTATGLPPGRYTLSVTSPGFSKTVRDQVNVEVATQATIDITLSAGGSDTTVEVTSPLISLNTTQPELGTTIEPAVVNSLPVAISGGRGRSIDTLQFLAPGVQGDTFSHQINGGVNFETEILYNGIPAPQSETAGYSSNFNPPFELVSQFRVERSTFSAQYGLAQGAVTYQTSSGTNSLHGDAFYINRNEFFDARGFFNSTTPIDRQNNYGFTIAGPVIIPHLYNGKDRTFFQFSLDFAKQANTNTNIGTVPTALEKTGNFSDFVDSNGKLIPIYDPQTGLPFPGNIIPQARFSSLSTSILPNIPDPDRSGVNSNKNFVPNAFPNVDHNFGFTIDHNITAKQSIHYAEWRNSFTSTGFDNAPIVGIDNPLQSAKNNPALGSVFLLNYTNAVTPKLVMTAGASWIGEINNQFNVLRGQNFTGVVANPISDIFPNVQFDGSNQPTSWGTSSGWTQSINRKLGIAAVNNWLWTKGRNTFNIGGEVRRSYQDDNECQACGGQFNFSQRTTADPSNLGTTGSAFASFLLGQVDSADRIFANELSLRNLLVAPYIQDDIKVSPKLTLNVGLRWDIMLPFVEKKNQIVFLDQTGANSAAGNLPGVATQFGPTSGITRADIHMRNFGPRLGFAYAINSKTVIQAGYNLAYLNGGAYEYGTSKVATSYGNLLQGSFNSNSTGTNVPSYGSWDTRPLPSPPGGVVSPSLGIGTTIRAFSPSDSGRPPYLQQWNFNVQHQLPWNTFLQVAYIGNRAVHLDGQLNPISQPNPSILSNGPLLALQFNQPAQAAQLAAAGFTAPYANFANDLSGSSTLAHALSPFPQYSNVYNNFDLSGAAKYNGLQMSLEKRFSDGLSFLTSYTLSRTIANVDSAFTTFASLPENKYNQKAEYTVSGSDELNNAKVSGTYELPIGPGKHFLNNHGVTGQIIGGIQLGFILSYQTGQPFTVGENGNPLGCSGCFNRPNVVSGAKISSTNYKNLGLTRNGSQSTRPVFTTAAFASTPQDSTQASYYVLGNGVRNYTTLRNPGNYDEDLKASKKFAFGEHVNFILEMNYFNLLNRTRFENVNNNGNTQGVGFGNNVNNTTNFGFVQAGQQNTQRQGQISGRLTF